MLLIQKSTTLQILLLTFLSHRINSGFHSLGSSFLKQALCSVNLDTLSYNSMLNKPKNILYFSSKIYFCNQSSTDNQGFLFSFSANSLSFCSTHSQISFFDGCQNISLKHISVLTMEPFVGLRGLDPSSKHAAHQQNPQSLALLEMTCKDHSLTRSIYGRLQNQVSAASALLHPCIYLCLMSFCNFPYMNNFTLMINLTDWYLTHRHNIK